MTELRWFHVCSDDGRWYEPELQYKDDDGEWVGIPIVTETSRDRRMEEEGITEQDIHETRIPKEGLYE